MHKNTYVDVCILIYSLFSNPNSEKKKLKLTESESEDASFKRKIKESKKKVKLSPHFYTASCFMVDIIQLYTQAYTVIPYNTKYIDTSTLV